LLKNNFDKMKKRKLYSYSKRERVNLRKKNKLIVRKKKNRLYSSQT